MKFLHISDLHIGKRFKEFSLIADQKHALWQILDIIDTHKPDAVLIAGDVYDKSLPSGEAVELFDNFLFELSERAVLVYIISGNHDSPERLAFASRLICKSGTHFSAVFGGKLEKHQLNDEFGVINIHLLPFIKPAHVRRFHPDCEINSYTDAVKTVIENSEICESERNIIVTHQFVTGALRSDSEEISVGGSDNVDATVFEKFDYSALGHIHGAQNISSEKIHYCGTPLKYSFSEINHQKTVTMLEIGEKDSLKVEKIPIIPLHDLREIRGEFSDVLDNNSVSEDYIHVVLTDEDEAFDAISQLRKIFPNLMQISYDNKRTRSYEQIIGTENVENFSPIELFAEFFEKQNGQGMSEEQLEFSTKLIEKIWEVSL